MIDISVVMPVYNGLPFLREAVESVLAQQGVEFELLIFNDASDDGSAEYLNSLSDRRVHIFHCEKQGYASLLNLGLKQASSDIIARMDADDVCLEGWLAAQVRTLQNDPETGVCGCQAELINEEGKSIGRYNYPLTDAGIRFRLLTCCAFTHPGIAYRRNAIVTAGGYDAEKVPCEDYDLWARMAGTQKLSNLGETFIKYRIHGSNVSFVKKQKRDAASQAIAIAQLLRERVATSAEDAKRFIQLRRRFNPDLISHTSLDEGREFCNYVQRFFSSYGQEGLTEVRRSIRWQLFHRAQFCSRFSMEYFGWLKLAISVDPNAMNLQQILNRAVKRAVPRWLLGATS